MTALEPIDPLPWVHVLALAAAFSVRCERCGASDFVYFAGAKKDPAMLRRVHDSHAKCGEVSP